jgi:HAD superfamily hydrolase (TIGR01493 family)
VERGRFRAVLFDFGDTLFHSPSGAEVIAEAGADEETAARMWDEIWAASKTAEELSKQRDTSPEAHRAAWSSLFARADAVAEGLSQLLYDRVMDPINWVPYPDTGTVLRGLDDAGVRIGVVSNIATHLGPVFSKYELDAYVDSYVHSFEHAVEKPAPALFNAACQALRTPAVETLMVGDSHLADGGAVLAGMTTLLLPPVERGARRGLEVVLKLALGDQ